MILLNTFLEKQGTFEYFENTMNHLSSIRKPPVFTKNNNHMNVIIAYRDPGDGSRESQLHIFVEHMNLIFKDKTNISIYIIEQYDEPSDYSSLPDNI